MIIVICILIAMASVSTGLAIFFYKQYKDSIKKLQEFIKKNEVSNDSPKYSTDILEFYKFHIQEFVVYNFHVWESTRIFEKTNESQMQQLYDELLYRYISSYYKNDINFEHCFFTESFLAEYIEKMMKETLNNLIHLRLKDVLETQ